MFSWQKWKSGRKTDREVCAVCVCVWTYHRNGNTRILVSEAHSGASVFGYNWQPCVHGSVYLMVCGWQWECVQLADVPSTQFSPPSLFCVLLTLPLSQLIQIRHASLAWLFQLEFTKAISSSQVCTLMPYPLHTCTSRPYHFPFSFVRRVYFRSESSFPTGVVTPAINSIIMSWHLR